MNILIILGSLGATEILLIIGVVILLFGGRKIPELMKGLGQGIREFKKASKGEDSIPQERKEPEKLNPQA